MSYEEEHNGLIALSGGLLGEISGFKGEIDWRGTEYMHISDYCDRGTRLVSHMRSALTLNSAALYADACILVRTSLEHQMANELMMLGDQYVQHIEDMDDESLCRLNERIANGELSDIAEPATRLRGGRVRIIRKGLRPKPDAQGAASPYSVPLTYFDLQNFDPLRAHPTRTEHLVTGMPRFEDDNRMERDNRVRYRRSVGFGSILDSLCLNGRYGEAEALRLQQHYSFLSAFAHATEFEKRAYPQHAYLRQPTDYQHCFSELILLYVVWIAIDQLGSMLEMIEVNPMVGFARRSDVEALLEAARVEAGHMWWPRQPVYTFDIIAEANQQHFDAAAQSHRTDSEYPDPPSLEDVEPGDVRYYIDPLKRIEDLHDPRVEMTTGLVFVPPWSAG